MRKTAFIFAWILSVSAVAGLGCGGDGGADAPPDGGQDDAATDAATSGDAATGTDAATDPGECTAGPEADAGGPDGGLDCPDPLEPDAPLRCFKRCEADDDCTHVSSTCCCDCNMGGNTEAIHEDHTDQWSERMDCKCTQDCDRVACTAVVLCPETDPTCEQGQCQAGEGPGS